VFTGLVEYIGVVKAVRPLARARKVTIDAGPLMTGAELGQSVSVSGACLTIASVSSAGLVFDVVEETVGRTNLARLGPGDRVNLERALKLGDRVGGHFVEGHVDGLGRLASRRTRGDQVDLKIDVGPELSKYMVPKGSVAVDGVSLTIVEAQVSFFSVCIVPHTIKSTTLGDRRPGDRLNIEGDYLAKLVFHYLEKSTNSGRKGLSRDVLQELGFIPAS